MECTPKIDRCVSLMNIPCAVTAGFSKENLLFFCFAKIETKLRNTQIYVSISLKIFRNSNLTVTLFSLILREEKFFFLVGCFIVIVRMNSIAIIELNVLFN